MIVGIPKEIKNNEFRVGMTPSGVSSFIDKGHQVYVQKEAGLGSGYSDKDYAALGAKICATIEEVYSISEMIVKVKEPLKLEYSLIKEFTPDGVIPTLNSLFFISFGIPTIIA